MKKRHLLYLAVIMFALGLLWAWMDRPTGVVTQVARYELWRVVSVGNGESKVDITVVDASRESRPWTKREG
jgi:hypothetical protein